MTIIDFRAPLTVGKDYGTNCAEADGFVTPDGARNSGYFQSPVFNVSKFSYFGNLQFILKCKDVNFQSSYFHNLTNLTNKQKLSNNAFFHNYYTISDSEESSVQKVAHRYILSNGELGL